MEISKIHETVCFTGGEDAITDGRRYDIPVPRGIMGVYSMGETLVMTGFA